MKITVATLCDFAQTREGMLFVSSGGITRRYSPQFPVPLGVMLALVIETSQPEIAEVVEVRVSVEDADGKLLAELAAGLQLETSDLEKGETLQVPLPFDLRGIVLPSEGRYMVRASLPGFDTPQACLSISTRFPPNAPTLPGIGEPGSS